MENLTHVALSLPAVPRGDRSVQLKSKRNFSGHMIVRSGIPPLGQADEGQVLETDSNLEMNIALILSMRPSVADLESQALFKWRNAEGRKKRHFFDFRASLKDGSRLGVIVKRSHKLSCPAFCALTKEISAKMERSFADKVIVMTERDVHPIEIHNASFLNGLNEVDPEADAIMRRTMCGALGARTIGSLVHGIGLQGRGFRAVGRLIRQQELVMVRKERITMEALVSRPIS